MTDESSEILASALQRHQAGRLTEAAAIYREILAADPDSFDAMHLLGVVALQEGRADEAIALIGAAVEKQPHFSAAFGNLGRAYTSANRPDLACACYARMVELDPNDATVREALAVAYQKNEQSAKALAEFRLVAELKPDSPEAHNNLAGILVEHGLYDEAILQYQHALSLRPSFSQAQFNLARTLQLIGRNAEALAGYQEAILENPELSEAHYSLGCMLHINGMLDDAIECYEAALKANSEYVEARWSLAMVRTAVVYGVGENPMAFREDFRQALGDLERWFVGSRVDNGYLGVGSLSPFFITYNEENNRELMTRYGDLCVRLMKAWRNNQAKGAPPRNNPRDSRIRLGIVSAHIREHSVWNAIIKGLCKNIDVERFALRIFFTAPQADKETLLAKNVADDFVSISSSLSTLTKEIIAQDLDAILYPEIGMDPMTIKLSAMRLAPVQMVTWGHPETTGLSTIDYYLSAEGFEPPGAQENYSERLVKLPNLGCNYHALEVPNEQFYTEAYNIDGEARLFLCPGTPFKYAPARDWIYTEIARRVGRCQFLFFHYEQENLSDRFRDRLAVTFDEAGMYIDEHVVFVPWLSRPKFYALLRRADIFLDTIGFSGFNTAMQAVECGLPIITSAGRFMRGRFGAAILNRMGLDEFVANSDEDYVEKAVRLGADPELRQRVREKMQVSRQVLFDDLAPIRSLEAFLVDKCAMGKSRMNG